MALQSHIDCQKLVKYRRRLYPRATRDAGPHRDIFKIYTAFDKGECFNSFHMGQIYVGTDGGVADNVLLPCDTKVCLVVGDFLDGRVVCVIIIFIRKFLKIEMCNLTSKAFLIVDRRFTVNGLKR